MNCAIEIGDFPTASSNFFNCVAHEKCRIGVCPFRIGIRKPFSDIAEGGRTQDGVGHGVQKNIRVAVTVESHFKGNGHSTQDQWTPRHKPMSIMTHAHSQTGTDHD